MSDHIPFELQIEIIKRLPIKSVIQFRSVSKAWKSAIDSADFIANYTVSQPQHLLIRYGTSEEIYVSIVDDDSFPQNKFSPVVPTSVKLLWESIVVGSSHGLICLFGYYQDFVDFKYYPGTPVAVLWNPSIRKSVAITVPDVVDYLGQGTDFGFGVCPATSDPKIVKIIDTHVHKNMKGVACSSRWQVKVFSLSSGVWRGSSGNLSDKLVKVIWYKPQVTINGFIYWLGVENLSGDGESNLIISFDLSTEEFKEIYLPVELASRNAMELYLQKRSDSLAVLKMSTMEEKFEVWITENGVSKSFMKLFTVKMPNELVHTTQTSSWPLECRRNCEFMMVISDDYDHCEELAVYEPLSERINNLGFKAPSDHPLYVSMYEESIMLLDQ